MSTVWMITTDNEEVSKWMNQGKDLLISRLVCDGIITSEKAKEIDRYFISMVRNRSLTDTIRRVLNIERDEHSTIIIGKL